MPLEMTENLDSQETKEVMFQSKPNQIKMKKNTKNLKIQALCSKEILPLENPKNNNQKLITLEQVDSNSEAVL